MEGTGNSWVWGQEERKGQIPGDSIHMQDSTSTRIVLSLSSEGAMGPSADLCWGQGRLG